MIHTVGPIGEKPKDLESCYKSCLKLMADHNLSTVVSISVLQCWKLMLYLSSFFQAFPCISTGIYGYPPQNAAPIALKAVRNFLMQNHGKKVDRIIFCLFMQSDVDIYEKQMQLFFPVMDSADKN